MQTGLPEWRQPSTHARHDLVGQEGSLDTALHLSRYAWARSRFCHPGERVLDLGCGTGFGVSFLADVARHATGVDFSEDGLELAQKLYASAKTTFLRADLTDPSLASHLGCATFDLVTSMETIEHLDDYFTFIASAARLLAPDGVFVLGTPNRRMTYERYPNRRHMDRSHIQEFTLVALEHSLREAFEQVEMYFQVIPGYWGPRGAEPSARSGRLQRLRESIPPRIAPVILRALMRAGVWDTGLSRSWSVEDIEFSEVTLDPTLESVAFSLIAVCRDSRLRGSDGDGGMRDAGHLK
jgi:SAM-dependent methyltransferase